MHTPAPEWSPVLVERPGVRLHRAGRPAGIRRLQHLPDSLTLQQNRQLVFAIICWGSFQPCLAELGLRQVPCFLNADSVQMQNLPTWPPGASFTRLRLST